MPNTCSTIAECVTSFIGGRDTSTLKAWPCVLTMSLVRSESGSLTRRARFDGACPMPAERWQLDMYLDAVDEWIEVESPPGWLRFVVREWLLSRFDDPYVGMRRAGGFENLWFAMVPLSAHNWLVVTCSCWIEERARTVRCDRIGSLGWPL